MDRPQKVINEKVYAAAKAEIKLVNVNSRVGTRLKALISVKEHEITLTAKILNICPGMIRKWSRRYEAEGTKGLEYRPGRGMKGKINKSQCATIKEWIKEDNSMTLKEIVIKVKKIFGISTSITAIHRILMKLGLAYITPRPLHYKQKKRRPRGV